MPSNASPPPLGRSRFGNRVTLAFALCPLLILVSCYGLWRWVSISHNIYLFGLETVYPVLFVIIAPLIFAFYFALKGTQQHEHDRLLASYQNRIDHMQNRLNAQEDFMRIITDNDPGAIAIFDASNRFWFANTRAAQFYGLQACDILGQPLSKVMSFDDARLNESRLKDVMASGKVLEALEKRKSPNGNVVYIQSRFEKIPPLGDFSGGVIARSENLTRLLVERERRETMLSQVINTLVSVIDKRDPYASGHSARVGQLSRLVAEEMVLNETEIETAEIAGSLMNFGKVLVPRSILTKNSALAPEELQLVRDSILTSAEILSAIDFATPIVPTLRQVLERFDGGGAPHGLAGDNILVTARIVTAANAFVAMVSARAHRAGMRPADALTQMMKEADMAFDRRVIVALGTAVQNNMSRVDWLKKAVTQA